MFSFSGDVRVRRVHTDRALARLARVLEEGEGSVIGGCLSSNAGTGAYEAWTDIDGVCVSWLHMHWREGWEWAWLWLVVVSGGFVGARPGIISSPEKGASPTVGERRCLQLVLLGEDELQCAVGGCSGLWDIEHEDGAASM